MDDIFIHPCTIKSPTSSAFINSKDNSYHALEKCEGVKRTLLFLFGCIAMRLFFVVLVKNMTLAYLPYLGYIGFLTGLIFIYLFIFGNKMADSQLAWTGEKYIWWNKLRIFHGFSYILFGVFAIRKQQKYAWQVLLLDVFVGFGAWINHRFF